MITCPFCGHRYTPRPGTTNPTTCCSQCGRKFPRPAPVIEVLGPITATATCQQCGRERSDLRACYVDDEAAIICNACIEDLFG